MPSLRPSSSFLPLPTKGLAIALLSSLTLIPSGCDWTMYRGNAARTGLTFTDTSQNQGKLLWNVASPGFANPSFYPTGPVVGSGPTIYAGGNDGKLYAFNSDGTQKWSFDTGYSGGPAAAAIASDGTIYATNGNLYAISSSGSLLWKFTLPGFAATGGIPFEPAIAADGTLYFGDPCGTVYAFTPAGSIKWTYTEYSVSACVDGANILQPAGTPAVGNDGTIYIPIFLSNSIQAVLVALTPAGTVKWISGFGGTPVVGSSGLIYFMWQNPADVSQSYLTSLDSSGNLRWQILVPCCGGLPALGSDGTIYLGTGTGLWAINPDSTIRWQSLNQIAFPGNPTIGGDGTIYVTDIGVGVLYAVNPNGSLKWSSDWSSISVCGARVNEPAIGPDGTIYVIPDSCTEGGTGTPLLAFR